MSNPSDIPNRAQHSRAWEDLGQAIAANAERFSETPDSTSPATPGELTIIGSGIETVGFMLGDEELIRSADVVFYCVADPATVVWLRSVRPDAYDLYVLYDDSKVRYTTYMQMTEAILHFVRQGRRVVAVYYGHPGIFVLSTHRAIMIARREGHRAVMRPSVCALDCLCADLGVDPCHPGMQTHEATDMLIRGRVPDTSLHVVLWQVGLIGEMGYRRKGYINNNFSLFISYLQQFYGDDYSVINYVASRYPTIDPMVEAYPLSALHDPRNQFRITGVSTFYLAPKDATAADPSMLARLGLMKPGQSLRQSEVPLREIGRYGSRERKAFTAFAGFKVPKGYHWQEDTGASRFLIALRQDLALRRRYLENPREALGGERWSGLGDRERALLMTRDAGAIQVAAKGYRAASRINRAALAAIFRRKPLQVSLLAAIRGVIGTPLLEALSAWSKSVGAPAHWEGMRFDIELAQRDCLFPWTGIYRAENGEGGGHLLVLAGDGKGARVSVDGRPIDRFSFRRGVLEWRDAPGAARNGWFRVDSDSRGRRRLIGGIWQDGKGIAAESQDMLKEVAIGYQHPAFLVGMHHRERNGDRQQLDIRVVESEARGRFLCARLNREDLGGSLDFSGRVLTVGDRRFQMALGSVSSPDDEFQGPEWKREGVLPGDLCGSYVCRIAGLGRCIFEIDPDGIRIDGRGTQTIGSSANSVRWTSGPDRCRAGSITLLLDPITLYPFLYGSVEDQAQRSRRCFGRIPAALDPKRNEPEFGLSPLLWSYLVASASSRARGDGAALWYQVEKANLASVIVNAYLIPHLP